MITLVRTIITAVTQGVIQRFSGTGRDGESFTSRELFQHYGFTSRPKAGAEGIALVQGNVVYLIASDDRRYRIELAEGEVALYTDQGDKVHLKRSEILVSTCGKVTVTAASSIDLTAPTININGDVALTGNMNATGNLVAAGLIQATGNMITAGNVSAVNVAATGNVQATGNMSAGGTIMDGTGNSNHHSHP